MVNNEKGIQDEKEVVKEAPVKKNPKDQFVWQPYHQPEFVGLVNKNTGEVIAMDEAIRRTLCYSEEAAKNTR